jgi:hypothetical protein
LTTARSIGERPPEQAAVDARVQGLDTAVEDLRGAGEVADLAHGDAGLGDRLRGAAAGQELDAQAGERAGELGETGLVGDGEQRPGELRHRDLLVPTSRGINPAAAARER